MKTAIRLAETEAERLALYAFRYAIYVEEMARPQRHADHAMRRISDPMDGTARNLIAWNSDEIVGCVRVNLARDGGVDYYRELLRMDAVGSAWPDAVSLCTRLMIRPEWRSSPLAMRLSIAAFELGLRECIRWNFIDCNDNNCRNNPFVSAAVCAHELTPAECSDGLDNNGNGFADCRDNSCNGTAACFNVNP